MVVGFVANALTTLKDVEAIKFDNAGDIEWVGIYSGAGDDFANAVIESLNGGYLITGYSTSIGDNTKKYALIMEISSTGQQIWSEIIGEQSGDSNAYTITYNSSIYIGGRSTAFGISNARDMFVVKLNSSGDLQWIKLLGGVGDSTLWKLISQDDGCVVGCGYTSGYG